jgi:hypothetical protein
MSNQYKLHSFGTILHMAIAGKSSRLPGNEIPVDSIAPGL